MKKISRSVVWMVVLALVLSMSVAIAASKSGKISVVIDRGIDSSMTPGQAKNRDQVGEAMEEDLVKLLKKAGYEANLIYDASKQYIAAEGSYLLIVKITNYNPGSKAARMIVGFGAGSTSMDTHIELLSGSTSILTDNFSVGSGRDWRNVVRKLDEKTVAAVKSKVE